MRDLERVLADLGRWSRAELGDGHVAPLAAGSREAREHWLAVAADGVEPLLATGIPDEPDEPTARALDDAQLESLALAVLVLGYEFLALHGRDESGRRELKKVYAGYRWIRPLRSALADLPDGEHRDRLGVELRRLHGHLREVLDEARAQRRALREAPDAADDDAEQRPAAATPGEGADAPPAELDDLLGEEIPDHIVVRRPVAEAAPPPPRREDVAGVVADAVADVTVPPEVASEQARGRASAWKVAVLAILILALLVSAGLTLPSLLRGDGGVAVYREIAPISAVIRPADAPQSVVFLFDERWDAMDEARRRRTVEQLYEAARQRDGVEQLICRDVRGAEVARGAAGVVTLEP